MKEKLILNKKARLEYEVLDTLEAGISLLGLEVKSLKAKHGSIVGAHVLIRGGEAFIVGMHIPPYQPNNTPLDFDPYRNRKLLLTKKELAKLAGTEKEKGLTLIALSLYNNGRKIKVELAIARGKKKYDKRQSIKKRDTERDIGRKLKNR